MLSSALLQNDHGPSPCAGTALPKSPGPPLNVRMPHTHNSRPLCPSKTLAPAGHHSPPSPCSSTSFMSYARAACSATSKYPMKILRFLNPTCGFGPATGLVLGRRRKVTVRYVTDVMGTGCLVAGAVCDVGVKQMLSTCAGALRHAGASSKTNARREVGKGCGTNTLPADSNGVRCAQRGANGCGVASSSACMQAGSRTCARVSGPCARGAHLGAPPPVLLVPEDAPAVHKCAQVSSHESTAKPSDPPSQLQANCWAPGIYGGAVCMQHCHAPVARLDGHLTA